MSAHFLCKLLVTLTVSDTPRECDLSCGLVVLLSDLSQDGVVHQLSKILALGVDWVAVSERRVLGKVNA